MFASKGTAHFDIISSFLGMGENIVGIASRLVSSFISLKTA